MNMRDTFPETLQPSNQVWRAAAAIVRGHVLGVTPEVAAKSMYPDDRVTPLMLRAASTQAVTTDPNWAGPLARYAVSQAIEDLVGMTAIARLREFGALQVDMGRLAQVSVPGTAITAANAGSWVQEGMAIQAHQYNYSPAVLVRRKLAVIVTLTREITMSSNIEDLLRKMLTQAAALAIDTQMFSATAADATKPAGLLYGLAAQTNATSTLGFDACGQDLGTLVQDIANRGGGAQAFFVAAPKQATTIRFFAGGQFGVTPGTDILPVAASVGLPAGTCLCIEPQSLAFMIADPEFSIGDVATIHQEDTSPATNLLTGTPVKSMFQIEAFALRMVVHAAWGMRAPHVSFVQGVTW